MASILCNQSYHHLGFGWSETEANENPWPRQNNLLWRRRVDGRFFCDLLHRTMMFLGVDHGRAVWHWEDAEIDYCSSERTFKWRSTVFDWFGSSLFLSDKDQQWWSFEYSPCFSWTWTHQSVYMSNIFTINAFDSSKILFRCIIIELFCPFSRCGRHWLQRICFLRRLERIFLDRFHWRYLTNKAKRWTGNEKWKSLFHVIQHYLFQRWTCRMRHRLMKIWINLNSTIFNFIYLVNQVLVSHFTYSFVPSPPMSPIFSSIHSNVALSFVLVMKASTPIFSIMKRLVIVHRSSSDYENSAWPRDWIIALVPLRKMTIRTSTKVSFVSHSIISSEHICLVVITSILISNGVRMDYGWVVFFFPLLQIHFTFLGWTQNESNSHTASSNTRRDLDLKFSALSHGEREKWIGTINIICSLLCKFCLRLSLNNCVMAPSSICFASQSFTVIRLEIPAVISNSSMNKSEVAGRQTAKTVGFDRHISISTFMVSTNRKSVTKPSLALDTNREHTMMSRRIAAHQRSFEKIIKKWSTKSGTLSPISLNRTDGFVNYFLARSQRYRSEVWSHDNCDDIYHRSMILLVSQKMIMEDQCWFVET